MRKFAFSAILFVAAIFMFAACDNYETYGEKKEQERNLISQFISDSAIVVISEAQFEEQGETTDVSKNEFVYLENSGIYMQIVNKGCGSIIEENKVVNLLIRYVEYNLNDASSPQTYNTSYPHYYDKMAVTRTGVNFTASFVSGIMMQSYSSSSYYSTSSSAVLSGWLVPLLYVKPGRPSSDSDELAQVKLIVPHSQGQAYAQRDVYPCYYIMTYQREK